LDLSTPSSPTTKAVPQSPLSPLHFWTSSSSVSSTGNITDPLEVGHNIFILAHQLARHDRSEGNLLIFISYLKHY
jgi:hypothetical protein